jgi:hypothetical protein
MSDDRRVSGSYPHEPAKVRVARIAKRQHNRIASHQIARLGVGGSTVRDWMRAGYLHPRLRGVRNAGWMVLRYTSDLIRGAAPGVRAEVLHHLATRAGLGTGAAELVLHRR